MSTGSIWPGDRPAPHDAGEAAEAGGPAETEETGGAEEGAEAGQPFAANGDEPSAAVEGGVETEETGDQEAVAVPAVAPPGAEPDAGPEADARLAGHAPAGLQLPDGVSTLQGMPSGAGRSVGIVVSRFNGDVTNRLLESAFSELDRAGVVREHVTVVPVPGAFELPLAAMGLAKTRRYACIVALGCVIRGETAHFDYVAGEAASGLQLAGLETGVPVAFGVLTVDTLEQAMARVDKGAEAVSSGLEMADLFSQVRAQARS